MTLATPKFTRPDDVTSIGYLWRVKDANEAELVSLDATLLGELIRDVIGATLVQGTGITVTVNDGADTITVATTITQYTDEMARDAIGAALVAGTNITITPNDGADTITVDAAASGAESLDELDDVTLTAPDTGHVLRHNGTLFVNVLGTTHYEAAGAVNTHNTDETGVHGIADTAALYRSGGTDVAVADGGTGSSTAGGARTNLGLVIGTDIQAFHARLADLAGITYAQGDILYFNGSNIVKLSPGTSGHVLTSSGAGANPAWAASGAVTGAAENIFLAQTFR